MHKKKTHSALFKSEVAITAIKGELTQAQISSKYEIHASQITSWKKQAIEAIKLIFASKLSPDKKNQSASIEQSKLYEEIGRLKVELDWLKKNLILNCRDKKMLIDPTNQQISITRQCQLVGLHRSNYYYQYQGVTESVEILSGDTITAPPKSGCGTLILPHL